MLMHESTCHKDKWPQGSNEPRGCPHSIFPVHGLKKKYIEAHGLRPPKKGFLREHVDMNHPVVYSSNSYAYCSGLISSLRSRMLHFFLVIIIIVDVIVLLLSLIHTQTHPSDCCWLGIVAIGRLHVSVGAGRECMVFLCFVHSSCWCYILYCIYLNVDLLIFFRIFNGYFCLVVFWCYSALYCTLRVFFFFRQLCVHISVFLFVLVFSMLPLSFYTVITCISIISSMPFTIVSYIRLLILCAPTQS